MNINNTLYCFPNTLHCFPANISHNFASVQYQYQCTHNEHVSGLSNLTVLESNMCDRKAMGWEEGYID